MRTLFASLALAAAPTLTLADSLAVYKYVDPMGRVTYSNVQPKQSDDYDVVMIEYDGPAAASVAPHTAPAAKPAAKILPLPAAASPQPAALAVLPSPVLRLAAVTFDAAPRALRRKAPPTPAVVLRLDRELQRAPERR